MSGIGAVALRVWQRLPRRISLTEQYSSAAPRWHAAIRRLGYLSAYTELIAAAKAHLRQAHQTHPSARALDLGTGTGGFALSVASWHRANPDLPPLQFDLLDPSRAMLGIATRHLAEQSVVAHPVCATIDALASSPERYWLVCCSHVLEHTTDVHRALLMVREALEPGGVFLLVASRPHWCTALLQFRWRNESWRDARMLELLAAAGFAQPSTVHFRAGPPSRTSTGYIAVRKNEAPTSSIAEPAELTRQ